MKKVLVIAGFMLSVFFLTAKQPTNYKASRNSDREHPEMRLIVHKNETQSPPFFTEDFSGGIPAGWTNVDNNGGGVLWRKIGRAHV